MAVMGTVMVALFNVAPVTSVWVTPPFILNSKVKGAFPLAAVNVITGAVASWQTDALPEIVAVDVA